MEPHPVNPLPNIISSAARSKRLNHGRTLPSRAQKPILRACAAGVTLRVGTAGTVVASNGQAYMWQSVAALIRNGYLVCIEAGLYQETFALRELVPPPAKRDFWDGYIRCVAGDYILPGAIMVNSEGGMAAVPAELWWERFTARYAVLRYMNPDPAKCTWKPYKTKVSNT